MIRSEKLKNHIETQLNLIAQEDFNYDIHFRGEVDFYDYEWVKRSFESIENDPKGIQVTPFVLTTNLYQRARDNNNDFNFRYTIIALPKEEDREKVREVYHRLGEVLDRVVIDGFNIRFVPTNVSFGADFSEGSGFGTKRFEAIFELEGVASNSLNLDNIELKFGDYNIPLSSFKYEHSKTNLLNYEQEINDPEYAYINNNLLVVETILANGDETIQKLLNKRQTVNMKENITLKVNGETIIDDVYDFENFALRYDKTSDRLVALLYFEYEAYKMYITINGEQIPIIDFAVNMVANTEPHPNEETNIIKSIYLGKAVSYAFNIVENDNFNLLETLYDDLLGDNERMPIYDLVIELGSRVYEKRSLLTEISKENKGTAKNIITVNFVDGSEL